MAYIQNTIIDVTESPESTIAFYNANAKAYVEATWSNDLSILYPELLDRLPANGLVLDAGCGSGRDTLAFLKRGFHVEAFDASVAIALLASERAGIDVKVQRFEEWVPPVDRYDGIWCFASLLHVDRCNLPDVLRNLRRALKPGGWLFASFKRGGSDTVDKHGRRFTNVSATTVPQLFDAAAGFEVGKVWEQSGPSGFGDTTIWVYVVARRPEQS